MALPAGCPPLDHGVPRSLLFSAAVVAIEAPHLVLPVEVGLAPFREGIPAAEVSGAAPPLFGSRVADRPPPPSVAVLRRWDAGKGVHPTFGVVHRFRRGGVMAVEAPGVAGVA